jgi:competence protein ComEA
MLKKILLGLITFVLSMGMALAAVNINTASQQELESLKGVGPAKAKDIIEYRKANGNFKTVEDLAKVKGFGDKSVAKLKPSLAVSGTTVVDAVPAKPAKAEKPAKAAKAEASAPVAEQSAAKADKKSKKKDK